MRLSSFIFTTIIIILLIPGLIYFLTLKDSNSRHIIPMKVVVASQPGFDLDNSSLILGHVPPGSKARRNITITNNFDTPVEVNVFVQGKMKPWIRVNNSFQLDLNESKDLMFRVSIPKGTSFGEYRGRTIITFKPT